MKVLIAEDNAFSCRLLVKTLEKAGYTAVVAEDGDAAWSVMQTEQAPSMVLLDWMMPGLQGIEVCERIRSLERTVPPYIIMLTAKADRDDVVQGFEAGADDYLKKPYDSSELLARMKVGARLVQQQALMHSLIDALPDPIYVKDSRGLYLGCNDAYAAFAGIDKDQIGQKQATDVLPDAQAYKTHMDDLRALAADEPIESEEWTVDADGKNVCHYSMRVPLMESSSGLRGLLVLHRDVSHESLGEKQLRYQHKLSLLFHNRLHNGEAKPTAFPLPSREVRLKNIFLHLNRNPASRIFHRKENRWLIRMLRQRCLNSQCQHRRFTSLHGIERIHTQICYNLLQLYPITIHGGQLRFRRKF